MEGEIVLISNQSSNQMLITAVINVVNNRQKQLRARILLDTCSTTNFMTEQFANKLKLEKRKHSIPVGAINGMVTYTKHQVTATIKSTVNKYERTLSFSTIPNITGLIPSQGLPRESFNIPKNLKLADPTFYQPGTIDILLGSGPTLALLCVGQYLMPPDLYLQKTQLGWIVGGSNTTSVDDGSHINLLIHSEFNLERFWKIEEIPKKQFLSKEEQLAENHYQRFQTRDPNGRYILALPFKEKEVKLTPSKDIALKRLQSLNRRFIRQPELKEQYTAVLKEYIDLGHMEELPFDNDEGFYLPHHAVFKTTSATTKVRVVFDGSAKDSRGMSLNEALLTGPTIQDDIFSIIMRFRFYKYVLTGDIEKMYRQFLIRPEDRKYQKILWYDENNQIKTYQLNTVTFGLSAAPFLAIRSLQQLAKDHQRQYPIAAKILQRDMYVDDLLTGFNTKKEVTAAVTEIIACLQQGALNIRQWASNDMQLLQHLPADAINKHLQLDNEQTLKTLGVFWASQSDNINYNVKPIIVSNSVTKRTILSHVASLFDPLGLLGPMILLAKSIIQKLWAEKVEWDESVPTSIHTLWIDFCDELHNINNLHFSRNVLITEPTEIQLHGFSDASERGYGACIYVRSIDKMGNIKTALLSSKSRVAPLKTQSIPRLELCAAHVLIQLYQAIKSAIDIPISKIIFWTDSMITLYWINTSPHQLKTFVANRISYIQENSGGAIWRHVRSEDNPADALSRGQLPKEFAENVLWQEGPQWLCKPETTWTWQEIQSPKEDPEIKAATCLHVSMEPSFFATYSSWTKLIRHVAIWRRYLLYLKTKKPINAVLTINELFQAQASILKLVQLQHYFEDMKIIADKNKEYRGKLKNLDPFIDHHGLLRVGGRLQNSKIPFDQKHPILLPKNHHITKLIILEEHILQLHSATQNTLCSLRRRFWIVDGRSQIKLVIRSCITCIRAKPITPQYKMGNLPTVRITSTSRAFLHVGVDFCGPFHIKETKLRNRKTLKIYVAVFICLTVKAVHLEVVTDLTTEGFLGALRRFTSRRGCPALIQSDNGTNFVGTNNELSKIVADLQTPQANHKITTNLASKGIVWRFSPPRAPHFGGIWEAAVKSFKHHLRRVVGTQLYTLEQFWTLTTEIEAVLNSRPLTPLSSDPNDLTALTPGHFLIGEAPTSLPEHDLQPIKNNHLSLWQHIIKMRQDFWTRWHKEYLNELNIRRKWTSGNHDIQLDTLVIIKEDNQPSLNWKLGRVIAVHPGKDNIIRVASIKTSTGIITRSIKRLTPLALSIWDSNSNATIPITTSSNPEIAADTVDRQCSQRGENVEASIIPGTKIS